MSIRISSHFDGGAIDVVDATHAETLRVRIRRDSHAEFRQWFYFRMQGAEGRSCRIVVDNAGECTYAEGWRNYRAFASYDRKTWFRIPQTDYDGQTLTITFTPAQDSVYLAYFEPYSWERHLDLLGWADASPWARVTDLGSTIEGRDLNAIVVGASHDNRQQVWLIARQHPGETMAEWFIEGLLERLLDGADPVARRLRAATTLHIVPNMNPDGSVRGNLRTNAAGANLNREWLAPDRARSPEVAAVRAAMLASGVNFFLDVHGDETLPYVFADGCTMLPDRPALLRAAEHAFLDRFRAASPDFQTRHGYAPDRFSDELYTLATKWVGRHFGCVALTLEMPFKDNADLPDGQYGWSAARSKRLGAAFLEALLAQIDSA